MKLKRNPWAEMENGIYKIVHREYSIGIVVNNKIGNNGIQGEIMAFPCAYVGFDLEKYTEFECLKIEYDYVNMDVHGGLTYSGDLKGWDEFKNMNCWFYGWDYGHHGDAISNKYADTDKLHEPEDVIAELDKIMDLQFEKALEMVYQYNNGNTTDVCMRCFNDNISFGKLDFERMKCLLAYRHEGIINPDCGYKLELKVINQ